MPVEIEAVTVGRVYVTHNYTFVQVREIGGGSVSYRERERNPVVRFLRPNPSMALPAFARFLRAEVNGEHFPDFANLEGYSFVRSDDEAATLRRFMATRAPHRPFVTTGQER